MNDNRPDFFERNCALLKNRHPQAWQAVAKRLTETEGEVVWAANGKPNLWFTDQNQNCVALHIPEDPETEARHFIDMVPEQFEGTVTLAGMGLGYAPLAIIQNRPRIRHLAVFEPSVGIFLQALRVMDLAALLNDQRLILGIGEEVNVAAVMEPAHKALQLEAIQNLQHLPSFALNFARYNRINQAVSEHCGSFNIEGNTLNFMGRDFLENRLRHLSSMHHNRFLEELAGQMKNVPAILVSAGPSLDKNVHLLAQAKGRALILAADSALPALAARGIMPDFVGTIDPLELIFEKVAGCAAQVHDVSLLCMSWASSKMAKIFPAEQIFWGFGSKPIEAWMASLFGNRLLTAGAGSVAHLNLLSSLIMECSPVVFIGQDLSFSPEKSHSANTVLQTNDLVNDLLNNKDDIVWLDGINGGKVISNRGMHAHKLFFEKIIKDHKWKYINATEGGCHIEGTEVMPLAEVLSTYCSHDVPLEDIIGKLKHTGHESSVGHLLQEFDKIICDGKSLLNKIDLADQLSGEILSWLGGEGHGKKRPPSSFATLPKFIQKKISHLDKINDQLDAGHSVWPLMQEVTIAGLRSSEQQRHAIAMLADNPRRYPEWLKKNAQRFLQINQVRREVLPLLTGQLSANIHFLKEEARLLDALDSEPFAPERLLELARLYFEAGNLTLARPGVERLRELLPESAEVKFMLGVFAAHYEEYARAESLFAEASRTEPTYAGRIASFRQQQGDAYIKYAAHFVNTDKGTCRRLLAKGLRYAPEHAGLAQHLTALCDQALVEMGRQESAGNIDKIESICTPWLADLKTNPQLAAVIGPKRTAQLHRLQGAAFAERQDYSKAAAEFSAALRLTPEDPALHLVVTGMYFAMRLYPQGIAHLEMAVSLDGVYAVHWEEIGDTLFAAGQHAEAITAYEKCFTCLPERINLIKKIGDCYLASDQLEAAREAYLQVKIKMQEIADIKTIVQ